MNSCSSILNFFRLRHALPDDAVEITSYLNTSWVCESVGKADLLSDHFDSKQSRGAVDLPLTCHPSPSLTTFAFRSREVRRLLFDLDPYGGIDPSGMFPPFLKENCRCYGPRLSVVFRRLVRLGSFPVCCNRPMSPQFQKVRRPPLLTINDRFP